MSTSKTFQQSLAEAGSEIRPPRLEMGSYIPWACRFKRFLNRKRENRKWLLKALEDGPYVFRNITPIGPALPRLQDVEDLQGDDLLYYDAEMELTNMILLSIPNEIYNSVDSCKTAKEMWDRVESLMRGTIQNQVDRETRFTNEFDQFVAEPGESLVSVYNRERVNIQRRNSGNVGRNNRRAYVQGEVVEGMNATNETANVQRIVRTLTPGNTSTGQCYNCGGKGHYARNCPKPRVRDSKYFMEQMLLTKQDEAGGILTDEQNDFLFVDASRMEEIEELSANIYLMARIQPADQNSDEEPSYESAFVSENSKRASMFYTSQEEIALNVFCRDQVKPLLNELLDHFDGFQNLFRRDIKEMKDVFEKNDVYLDEIERQNDLLKDQLLEVSLKHDIELCVLLSHECVDESLRYELETIQKET
ncbi:integrase, catalytic region, zinc finger, CCHC-type containing protein [Tanacetum coccineum]